MKAKWTYDWSQEPDQSKLREAYETLGDNAEAGMIKLKALAYAGSPMSMNYIGQHIARNAESQADMNVAIGWFRRAAELSDHPYPAYMLSRALRKIGSSDDELAVLRSVKQTKYPPALSRLGNVIPHWTRHKKRLC